MAEIPDPFGRVNNFSSADFETLAKALKSAVGTAVKFMSDQSKSSASASSDLGKSYEELRKSLKDLGDDINESIESNKKLVDEIGKVAETIEKKKESIGKGGSKDDSATLQREQIKVLNTILRNQQKAIAEKVTKFSPGFVSAPRKAKASLENIGFKPRGTDTVPAMLSPGEFIVNRRGAQGNRGILDRINKGYRLGGRVKPSYLSTGSDPVDPASYGRPDLKAGVEIKAENIKPQEQEKFKNIGSQISSHVEEGFKGASKRAVAAWFTGLGTALLGGQADFMQTLFGGGVADAVHFRKEMREIAFQTQGITGNFREMQNSFSNLGTNIVAETGKSVDVLQRTYMANLKKGFKDQKAGLKVMKSGLFLSTMIGSEAEQTANLFGDWHRTLGLSANEMEKMARDMRSVSLSTGVTGDDLLDAMKSSEGILKNMRNQGNLTSDAAKSIVTMMAEAKKGGFEESTSKVLGALSSSTSMMNSDSATRGLIYTITNRMGGDATKRAQQGTLLNDKSNLAGFSNELLNLVGGLSNGAIKTIDDFEKLGEEEKFLLSMRLKNYGLEIGEAKALIEQTRKAGMSLQENIAELDKLGSKKFATEEEKKLVAKQKDQLYASAATDYLSGIREKSSGDESLAEVMNKMASDPKYASRNKDFAGMAGGLTPDIKRKFGISGTEEQMAKQMQNLSELDKAKVSALVQNQSLMKAAKEQGKPVKDLTSEIMSMKDNNSFNKVADELGAYGKELAVSEANAVDPQKELVLTLNKLNETIRGYTSSIIGSMVDFLGATGLLLGQIGLMTMTLYSLFGQDVLKIFGSLGSRFGSLGSKFDDFTKKMAKSDSDGIFNKFFKTYAKQRAPGVTAGGFQFREGQSVFASLKRATDDLGNNLKNSLVEGIEGVGRKGNIVFNRTGKQINLFGGKIKDSLSGAFDAFKNARTPSTASRMMDISEYRKFRKQGLSALDAKKAVEKMGGFSKGKGVLSSLTDAGDFFIKNMTGKADKLSGLIDTIANSKTIKSVKGAFDVFKNARKGTLGTGAFGRAGRASKGIFSSLTESVDFFIGNMTGKAGKVSAFFEKITSIFSSFFAKLKNFKLSNLKSIPNLLFKGVKLGLGGMVKGAKSVISGGVGGIFKGIGAAIKGGGKLLSGGLRAALLGGTMGTAQIVFAAIDMVFGAVSGFNNTGKNFKGVMEAMGKSTKDVTWGMYASSTVAGALVGILDGLTFGLLSMTGVADFLNKTLSLLFYTVFSVVEGFINGIMVAFDMVRPALKGLYDAFAGLGTALLGLFNSIASIFGASEAKNASEAFAMLYSVLKPVGKLLGMVIGVPLGAVLWTLVSVIGVVVNSVTFLVKIFTNLVDAIVAPFKWLFDVLVGHSIIPDLCTAIVGIFGGMAKNVIKSIVGLPGKAIKFIASLPKTIFKGLQNAFFKAPKKVFEKIFKHINTKTLRSGLGVISDKFSSFFNLFKSNLSGLTKFFKNSWYDFLNTSTGGLFGKLVDTIKNSKMYKAVDDFLIKPITNGLSWLGQKAKDIFKNTFSWIKDKVGKLIPGLGGTGSKANPFSSMGGTMGKAAKSTASELAEKGGAKAITSAIGSADDLAKASTPAFSFLGKSSKLMGSLAKKLPVVGPLLDFGIRKVSGESTGKALTGTAAGAAGGLGGVALGASIGTLIFPGVGTAIGGLLGGIIGGVGAGMASDAIYDKVVGTQGSSVNKAADKANAKIESKSESVATPVGQHAIPVARPEQDDQVGNVQPMHLRDITESILRERAAASGGTSKLQSDELSRMEEASARQVEELEQIKEGINELVSLMKPKGVSVGGTGEMGAGKTKDPRRPLHAAKFGKMKYGKAGGNANRTLINNGES